MNRAAGFYIEARSPVKGYISSAVKSPATQAGVALGYVRREVNAVGTKLTFATADTESTAKIVES